MPKPLFIMIAGPNGSGKSTIAEGVVRDRFGVDWFLNADTIARGFAPWKPALASVAAGRSMLMQLNHLIDAGESVAIETTLSGSTYARYLQRRLDRYETWLFFVYVDAPDLSVDRVAHRVATGGHDIPEADIRRRFDRSLRSFFSKYRHLVDGWEMSNNSDVVRIVAKQHVGDRLRILDPIEWNRLEQHYDS